MQDPAQSRKGLARCKRLRWAHRSNKRNCDLQEREGRDGPGHRLVGSVTIAFGRRRLPPRSLISGSAFFASSIPAKLAGELSAAVKALRAPSLSPTFTSARPRRYWTTGSSGSFAALSVSKVAARWYTPRW